MTAVAGRRYRGRVPARTTGLVKGVHSWLGYPRWVGAVEHVTVKVRVPEDPAFGHQRVERCLDGQLRLHDPLFQKPPVGDALDRVLGLGMAPEVAENELANRGIQARG